MSILVAVAIGATAAAECLLDCVARAGWIAAARAPPESGGSFCRVPLDAPSPPVTRLQRRRAPVQLPDLCALYLGDAGYAAYVALISGYMLGSLWCYAAIFAAALEANLAPSGHVLYVGVFALFVVPLSLKDLADQKASCKPCSRSAASSCSPSCSSPRWRLMSMGPIAPMPERTGTFDGVAALAPVVTFSLVLHHSVPQMSRARSKYEASSTRTCSSEGPSHWCLSALRVVRRAGGLPVRGQDAVGGESWAGPRTTTSTTRPTRETR